MTTNNKAAGRYSTLGSKIDFMKSPNPDGIDRAEMVCVGAVKLDSSLARFMSPRSRGAARQSKTTDKKSKP